MWMSPVYTLRPARQLAGLTAVLSSRFWLCCLYIDGVIRLSCVFPLFDAIGQRLLRTLAFTAMAACFAGPSLSAEIPWTTLGPDGGDARSLAFVPNQPTHLYLGTTNSWIYESLDQGGTWHRLAELDSSEDVVIDNIVIDAANPNRIWAGGWKPDQRDGGLWVSQDAGHTWKPIERLRGQSVFALAQAHRIRGLFLREPGKASSAPATPA